MAFGKINGKGGLILMVLVLSIVDACGRGALGSGSGCSNRWCHGEDSRRGGEHIKERIKWETCFIWFGVILSFY